MDVGQDACAGISAKLWDAWQDALDDHVQLAACNELSPEMMLAQRFLLDIGKRQIFILQGA